jgi:hypothetical protein
LAIRACLALPLAAALGGLPPPAAAADHGLCAEAAARAARATGVPAEILAAVMRAESGRPRAGAAPEPWPWTLHDAGEGLWFASRAEAAAHLAAALAAGRTNIDVGCFQVNLHWHGAAFDRAADLLDPAANALYAAGYLAELRGELGTWRAAAGAYHSRNGARAEAYVRRLEALHAAAVTSAAPVAADPPAEPHRGGGPLLRGAAGPLIGLP